MNSKENTINCVEKPGECNENIMEHNENEQECNEIQWKHNEIQWMGMLLPFRPPSAQLDYQINSKKKINQETPAQAQPKPTGGEEHLNASETNE